MTLTKEQEKIKEEAIAFAKKNKKDIAKKLTDKTLYKPEDHPVSCFMAGSPGAGKSEFAIEMIAKINDGTNNPTLYIDPDDIRQEFSSYNGANSHLFHAAVSIIVEKAFDLILKNKQSFILDGTLSNHEKSEQNIARCLKRNRGVFVWYVYQNPLTAWDFVLKRERVEGRRIARETFIIQYFNARKTVNGLKQKFGQDIHVDLLLKDIQSKERHQHYNVDNVDSHIPETYNSASLEAALNTTYGESHDEN